MTSKTFIPLPKQYIAMTSPARETFFAGAAGPGKSALFINLGMQRALRSPGSAHVFFRRISKDSDTHVREARKFIETDRKDPDRMADYTGDRTAKKFTFPNNSEFQFTHLANEDHVEGHGGAEYDTVFFDEAGRFTPSQINFLMSRVRSTIPETRRMGGPKLFLASNPVGVSLYYLRQNYVEPDPSYVSTVLGYYPIDEALALWEVAKRGLQVDEEHPDDIQEACRRWIDLVRRNNVSWRQYDEETQKTKKNVEPYDVWTAYPNETMIEYGITETHSRVFIPAFLEDNPYLGEDYVIQLAQLHGSLAPALLKGDWSTFEGQFFKEFAPQKYNPQTKELEDWHVIPPLSPPDYWTKLGAFDWGYSERAKAVFGFFAYDIQEDQWVMWDEIAVNQRTDSELASLYHSYAGGHMIDLVSCDPAIFGKKDFEKGMNQGEFFKRAGVPLSPADNARIPGWQMLRSMLATNPRTGKPYLRICSNCEYTIKSLPGLVHRESGDPEDLDTEGDDHAADMLRYFAVKAHARGDSDYFEEDDLIGVGVYDASSIRNGVREIPEFLMGDEDESIYFRN